MRKLTNAHAFIATHCVVGVFYFVKCCILYSTYCLIICYFNKKRGYSNTFWNSVLFHVLCSKTMKYKLSLSILFTRRNSTISLKLAAFYNCIDHIPTPQNHDFRMGCTRCLNDRFILYCLHFQTYQYCFLD